MIIILIFDSFHLESDIILGRDKVALRLCIQKNSEPEQMGGTWQDNNNKNNDDNKYNNNNIRNINSYINNNNNKDNHNNNSNNDNNNNNNNKNDNDKNNNNNNDNKNINDNNNNNNNNDIHLSLHLFDHLYFAILIYLFSLTIIQLSHVPSFVKLFYFIMNKWLCL